MDEKKIQNQTNNEDLEKQVKMQEDLIHLMKVLDKCIESMDKFYYFAKTKQMLELSNNN